MTYPYLPVSRSTAPHLVLHRGNGSYVWDLASGFAEWSPDGYNEPVKGTVDLGSDSPTVADFHRACAEHYARLWLDHPDVCDLDTEGRDLNNPTARMLADEILPGLGPVLGTAIRRAIEEIECLTDSRGPDLAVRS